LTKREIDKYFQANWQDIQNVVKNNANKCATKNITDISSDIYLVCIEKANRITNLPGFIRILASNLYRWQRSSFNAENRVTAHNEVMDATYNDEQDAEDVIQERLFMLEKYRLNAEPHELIFYDIYVNRNIRSVRKISNAIGVTGHGARVLVNDFKQKIKSYERQG
jgi:hypothetical protein